MIIQNNYLKTSDIKYVAAAGMITSNLGIQLIPHLEAPADMDEFSNQIVEVDLEGLPNLPILMITGLKNQRTSKGITFDRINDCDIMRGEEVETFGLMNQMGVSGKGVLVLPGSHTKYVFVNEEKKLTSCLSTLGGETIFAIQKETILSSSINSTLMENLDESFLLKGYESAHKVGLMRSFYHIRLLELYSDLSSNQRANYLVGAILEEDLKALESFEQGILHLDWVIIGGSDPLKKSFSFLLKHKFPSLNIINATDKQVEYSTVIGMKLVADQYVDTRMERMH